MARPILGATVLALTSIGADDPKSAPPALAGPVFTATLTDAKTASGRLRQLGGPEGKLTLVDEEGAEQSWPLNRLVKLARAGDPPQGTIEGQLVLFPDGDRLRVGSIGASTETTLDVRAEGFGELKLPLEAPLGLVLNPPGEADAAEGLLDRVRREPRKAEVLWLANGDRMDGGLLGLGPQTVRFEPEAGKLEVNRSGIVAIGFDPKLVSYPTPKGDWLELTLDDGTRLGVSQARVEQGVLLAKARFGASVRLGVERLARVHSRTGSVAYLSERAADAERYTGYVGPVRPYRRDLTVDGHSLRLGGEPFDHGLGTTSKTILAYKLAPGDRRFQALVGLDDRAGPLGSAVFRVLVDGRERFASPPMSAREAPRPVDVDLAGAKVLFLVTEFGERGDVRDLADWAEARLIR
jgi:hypothetical protein